MQLNYADLLTSNYWKSCEAFMPSRKHIQTKSETYTVEGYNSRINITLQGLREMGNVTVKRII
jgi:insertion element IS1 protein InsB